MPHVFTKLSCYILYCYSFIIGSRLIFKMLFDVPPTLSEGYKSRHFYSKGSLFGCLSCHSVTFLRQNKYYPDISSITSHPDLERWSRSSSLWKSNLNFFNFSLFIHRLIQYLNLDVVKSSTIFDLEKVTAEALENASIRKENGFNRRKRKFTSQHWNKKKGSKQKIDVSRLNFLESLKSLLFH